MNTDLIVRFIQNIRVHRCPSVVYKYTNLVCSTLGSVAGSQIKRAKLTKLLVHADIKRLDC